MQALQVLSTKLTLSQLLLASREMEFVADDIRPTVLVFLLPRVKILLLELFSSRSSTLLSKVPPSNLVYLSKCLLT